MYPFEASFSVQYSGKLVMMFVFDDIWNKSRKMYHVEPKTRSLGQIIQESMLVTKGL